MVISFIILRTKTWFLTFQNELVKATDKKLWFCNSEVPSACSTVNLVIAPILLLILTFTLWSNKLIGLYPPKQINRSKVKHVSRSNTNHHSFVKQYYDWFSTVTAVDCSIFSTQMTEWSETLKMCVHATVHQFLSGFLKSGYDVWCKLTNLYHDWLVNIRYRCHGWVTFWFNLLANACS